MKSLSMTDHGTIAGAYQFVQECRKVDIKPILGMEAYYTINDRSVREKDIDDERYYHLVLLAENNVGWKNLMALSTRAYTEGMFYKPRLDDALLGDHSEGIHATTACLGSRFSKLLLLNRRDEAERLVLAHSEMFKDRFYVELQLHEDEQQQTLNEGLIEIARKYDLPLVLTADSHYTHQDHKDLHEQALCMQTNDVMTNPKRFSFGDIDVHLGSCKWMTDTAIKQGIPYSAITNTVALADLIDDQSYFADRMNRYPRYPHVPDGKASWEALERLAKYGLLDRFGGERPPQNYIDRINHELKVIKRMGFDDYILIIQHLVNTARKELGVYVGPGRGSAVGSLVAYSLGITQVDPIEYGLLFQRFLNEGRASTPLLFTPAMRAQTTTNQP